MLYKARIPTNENICLTISKQHFRIQSQCFLSTKAFTSHDRTSTHQFEFYKSVYEWIHKVSLYVCISCFYWFLNVHAMWTRSNSTSVCGICRQHHLQDFFSCLVELSSFGKRNFQDLSFLSSALIPTADSPERLGIFWISHHFTFK